MATFFDTPTRSVAPLRRETASWTSQVANPSDPAAANIPIENPWIPAEIIGDGDFFDERHWLVIERDPAISGAMASRIASLLGGGLRLEPGEGPGASELFDYWSWLLEEHPLTSIMATALRCIFRGWECFGTVGAWREWEGKRVFVPISIKDSLTWNFRWTPQRNLLHCPGGIGFGGMLYPHSTWLPAQMKWWTPRSGLSNPYGDPLHGKYIVVDYAYRQLSEAAMVQIRQAQGFLSIAHDIPIGMEETAGQTAALEAQVTSIITKMQASGILVKPPGWSVDWVNLTSSLPGWIELFNYFGGEARTFYAGSNLPSQMTGGAGSRALGEVQERTNQRRAQVDAANIVHQLRAGLLRPWSAWNAATISPELPHRFATPRLEDVPMASVPTLTFTGLERMTGEDLEFLKAIADIGVVDSDAGGDTEVEGNPDADSAPTARVDVEAIFRQRNIPILPEGEIGATLDMAKKEPPPSPFMPADPEEIEQAASGKDEQDVEVQAPTTAP